MAIHYVNVVAVVGGVGFQENGNGRDRGHLNNICTSRGVRPIPERDVQDSIERFDLGDYLLHINVLGKLSRLLC